MAIKAAQAKQAHRNLAWFLLVFLVIHFATHLTTLGGIDVHTKALTTARILYQFPVFEIALVLGLAVQVVLGIKLLRIVAKRPHKDFWHWVQFLSACYLAFFIVLHTTAATFTRLIMGLDTNFYWASATLVIDPLRYGFTPYYILAVTALFSHIIAALHFRCSRKWQMPALLIGPLVGIAIILGFGGHLFSVELPQEYLDYYAMFPGVAD